MKKQHYRLTRLLCKSLVSSVAQSQPNWVDPELVFGLHEDGPEACDWSIFLSAVKRLRKEVRRKLDECEVQIGQCREVENLFGEG